MENSALNRALITSIIKRGTEFTEAISLTLKQDSLTIQQFNVLRILRGRKGKPASLQDVSKDMIHSNSNTTRVIDKLVDKKMVKRVQSPSDRRQIELTITQEGLELLKSLDAKVENIEHEIIQNLKGNEIIKLAELLQKI